MGIAPFSGNDRERAKCPTRMGLPAKSSAFFAVKPYPGLPFAILGGVPSASSDLGLSRSFPASAMMMTTMLWNTVLTSAACMLAQELLLDYAAKGRIRDYANEGSTPNESFPIFSYSAYR